MVRGRDVLTGKAEVEDKCVAKRALLMAVDDITDEDARSCHHGTQTANKGGNRDTRSVTHGETGANV